MTITIPGSLQWVAYLVGEEWPEGDEDAMKRLGSGWRTSSGELKDLVPDLNRIKEEIRASFTGESAQAVDKVFSEWFSGDYAFDKLADAMDGLADLSDAHAMQVQYTKLMILTSLGIAAVEIAFALASAWATFGGSLGTIPIIEALTTMAVRQAMSQLLRQIVEKLAEAGARTAIKQLVKEFGQTVAKQAAKKAAERVARQAARSTVQKIALGAGRVAANVAFETAIGVGQEVGIQAYQINDGMRDKFNTGQIRDTAISSAAGALGGQVTAFGAGKLLKNTPLGHINNTAAGRFTSGALTGYSAGVVGNLAGTGALWVGNHDTQFTALSIFGGASSGALSGGVHGGLDTHSASAGDTGNSGHNGGTGTNDGGNSTSGHGGSNTDNNGSSSNSNQNGSPSNNSNSTTTESGSPAHQPGSSDHGTQQHGAQPTNAQPHETNGSQANASNGSTQSHPDPAAGVNESAAPTHPNDGTTTQQAAQTTTEAVSPHTPTNTDTPQTAPSNVDGSAQPHSQTNTESMERHSTANSEPSATQHQNQQQAVAQQPTGTQPLPTTPGGTQPSGVVGPTTTQPATTSTTPTNTTSTHQTSSSATAPAHAVTPSSQTSGAPATHRADSTVAPAKAPEAMHQGQQVTSSPEPTRTQPSGTSNDKAGPVAPQTRPDAPQQVRSDSNQSRTDAPMRRDAVGPDRSTPERGDHTRSSDPNSTDQNTQVNDEARADDGRVKLSGHGTYNPENGTVTVPKGTSVTVYAEHGARITDGLGNRIETGQDVSGVYSRTYTEGEVMPNYTLHPPDGLDTQGTPHTVDSATNLRDILSEGMGPVDWAACVEAAVTPDGGDAPGRHKLYDTTRIGDKSTGETTYYRGPDTDTTSDRHGDATATRSSEHSPELSHKSHEEQAIDSLAQHRTGQHEGATADDTRNAHDQAQAVREKWDALTSDEQKSLVEHETQPRHRTNLGDLDGLPAHVRDTLNRHNLVEDMVGRHPKLESQIREYANAMDDYLANPGEHPKPDHFDPTHDKPSALNRLAALFDSDMAPYKNVDATWRATYGVPDTPMTPTRQLLTYDPKAFGGDGRIAVVVGDLDAARVVSVHTPGITSTIRSIEGNITNAENHHIRSNEQRPDQPNAVIAWIGYDAPSGLGLARTPSTTLARLGGYRLAHDVAALAGTLGADTRINMFGHSYGSTTTAFAGQHGRLANYVDTVTLLGSPGAGPLHHASDFGIGAENVYVASNSHDLVTWLGGTHDGHFNRISGRLHLGGLGFDPAMREFGATRIAAEYVSPHHTDGLITAHVNYFSTEQFTPQGENVPLAVDPHARPTESLANFVHISTGDTHRLTLEAPDPRTSTPTSPDQHGRVGTSHDAATYRHADPPTGYPGPGQCVPSVLQDLGGSHVWQDTLGNVGPEGTTRGAFEAALGTHLREGTAEDIIAATQRGEQVVVVQTYDRAGIAAGHPGAHTFLVKPNPDDPARPLVVDRQTGGAHPWPPRDLDRVTHTDIATFNENSTPTHPMDPRERATYAEHSTDRQRIGQTALEMRPETERGSTPEDGFQYPKIDEVPNVGQDNPLTVKYPNGGDELPRIDNSDQPEISYPKLDEISDTGRRNTLEVDYPNIDQLPNGHSDLHGTPPEIDHAQTAAINLSRPAEIKADRPADIDQARPAEVDLNRPADLKGDRPAEFGNDRDHRLVDQTDEPGVPTARGHDDSNIDVSHGSGELTTPDHQDSTDSTPIRLDPIDAIMPVLEKYGVTLDQFMAMQEHAATVGRDELANNFSTEHLQMMYEARMSHPHPTIDDVIQKVVAEGAVKSILDQVNNPGSPYGGGGPYKANDAGGCVSVKADTTGLRTPEQLLRALRLDYGEWSPYEVFTTTDHAYVIEGRLSEGEFSVPNGRIATHLGIDDPRTGDLDNGAPPHTGTGYTGDPHGINPEYQLTKGRWEPGATLIRIDPDGSRHPVAILDDSATTWTSAKTPSDHVVDRWPPHQGGDWVFPDSPQHGPHPDPPTTSHRGSELDHDLAEGGHTAIDPYGRSAAADVFRQSAFDTHSGAAFFDPTDTTMRSAAGNVPKFPGEFTVDVHGDQHGVSVRDGAGNEHRMSAREFAEIVRSNTGWDGHSPIRLLSCDTGAGSHPFAAELARELGVAVTAPDKPVWTFPDGRQPIVTGFDRGINDGQVPRIPPDGGWHRFSPDWATDRTQATDQTRNSPVDGAIPRSGKDPSEPDASSGSTDSENRRQISEDPVTAVEGHVPPMTGDEKIKSADYRDKYYDEVTKRVVRPDGTQSTESHYRRKNADQKDYDGHQVPIIRRNDEGDLIAVSEEFHRATIMDGSTTRHEATPEERALAQDKVDRRTQAIERAQDANAKYRAEIARNGDPHRETVEERSHALHEQTLAGEDLGEHAAANAVRNMFPDDRYEISDLTGNERRSGQFDQIYEVYDRETGDERVVIVEAKGTHGQLGVRAGLDSQNYQQGHREYVRSIIDQMMRGTAEERAMAYYLNDALENGTLEYYVVNARVESTPIGNEYDGYKAGRFQIYERDKDEEGEE
ncbi:alpha/beta hydrolase [Mycobacteroides saopaulense]|uniref:Uncharacterized protein n=1 Tax=Mycobacteroides saopaulense TaxID=1578165 RepID=A0ABX3BWG0_9MYCO|nr:alpha/beta hydrolase [Mycobacteroides saopaulense]OHT81187.1 hypothetical protein BKG68_23380 [Mycobacteroides saopaulense]OHU07336.1 hypothetical protein BKG73_18985 [Mycobacteroides saopaulense]